MKICLIHHNADEAPERLERLARAGFPDATHVPVTRPQAFRTIRDLHPDAVVIDLSRLPSHGRETALHLRLQKTTRHVPIVFVGGEPDKVERLRSVLPDATYTDWPKLKLALRQALKSPPAHPLIPKDGMAGYSGTPLPKKLGIKPNFTVSLAGVAPDDFITTTLRDDLPPGVTFTDGRAGKRDLTIWFVTSVKELTKAIPRAVAAAEHGPVWFAWPKKASGVVTDLAEQTIRDAGLAVGLVDYKICAIDHKWSGLLFCKRKTPAK